MLQHSDLLTRFCDFEIVLCAVKQDGLAFQWASLESRCDPILVSAAVKQNGLALQFASRKWRNNYKIVFSAVSQNGKALEYASKDMLAGWWFFFCPQGGDFELSFFPQWYIILESTWLCFCKLFIKKRIIIKKRNSTQASFVK